MRGTLGIVLSISVGTTVLAVLIAVLLVKCYLNWKRQNRKQKKQSGSVDGTVQQLVISSQPVDFFPLMIQDQLEGDDDSVGLANTSIEDLAQSSEMTDSKESLNTIHGSVVSTVDTKAPRSKITKSKPFRKKSRLPERRGNVAFKVNYINENHALEVHLINAKGLSTKQGNLLDPFAQLSLKTPSKHHRRESKLIKKTCNPIFDERFFFDRVYLSELQQAHLKLKIMNRVGVSRCELIGEAVVSLYDEDVMRGDSVCRDLFEKAGKSQCTGELLVSICHQATSSHLKVVIMRLKDLPKSVKNPTVTVELTHKNEILQQHQVKTKRKTLSLNKELDFEVATDTTCPLETFGVQFTVYHHDFIRGNEIIGQVRLAMDAPLQSEMKHWTAVVVSPHKPIAEWHKFHAPLQ